LSKKNRFFGFETFGFNQICRPEIAIQKTSSFYTLFEKRPKKKPEKNILKKPNSYKSKVTGISSGHLYLLGNFFYFKVFGK